MWATNPPASPPGDNVALCLTKDARLAVMSDAGELTVLYAGTAYPLALPAAAYAQVSISSCLITP